MKKTLFTTALSLGAVLTLTLTGCGGGSGAAQSPAPAGGQTYRIAIVQQLDHASLDEIRAAIIAELEARGAKEGFTVEYKEYFGQNDPTLLGQIGAQVAAGDYDLVIPIASMAAQYMVTATEEQNMPVVYAAISDPEAAGLTGIDRVTGTSDALNTPFILDMMLAYNPEVKNVGLLYSLSETNSAAPIAQAKEYLDAKGIGYVEKTASAASEVVSAANSLVGQVDAVFTPTDNVIMASELAIADTFKDAKLPHYTGADSFVRNGAFTTCGVNYTELGTYTAGMAIDVLQTGVIPEYHVMEGGIITVNTDTAAALGADYSVFASMTSSPLNEVVTTEE
ncbi:ABC transporter substrate-binding protein [Pseudoflavonifractor sp. 524-17]|uniref:ABC transporter substrate-binding protein n=1 Tax=Pseudoflavonifractor sp. 524-17 TaxID=2304577 RepID=UPI00137A1775|nr:ABC transporter substrate-binding protein [Pseudoflavonifractor sp. 524-17]NCE65003.1 ABC transporter substrate-binding protein [Pseudoflavonifractor sp. 524-17]